jgi:hypothetical protein
MFFRVRYHISQLCKTAGKWIVWCILMFVVLEKWITFIAFFLIMVTKTFMCLLHNVYYYRTHISTGDRPTWMFSVSSMVCCKSSVRGIHYIQVLLFPWHFPCWINMLSLVEGITLRLTSTWQWFLPRQNVLCSVSMDHSQPACLLRDVIPKYGQVQWMLYGE